MGDLDKEYTDEIPADDDDIEIPDGDDLSEPVIKKEIPPEELAREKTRRRRIAAGKLAMVLILIGCIAGAGLYAVYDHYADYYETHFYEGTTINGTDVSFRTADVILKRIRDDVGTYTLTVKEKDGKEEILTAEDLGWAYADDGAVEALLEAQDARHWYRHLKEDHTYQLRAGTTYDQGMAGAAVHGLACFQKKNVRRPVDAALVQRADGTYEVMEEVEGNKLDRQKAEKQIMEAIDSARESVDLTEPDCYLHPQVYADNKNLCRRRDQWNRLLGIDLVYRFGDDSEVLNRENLLPYITDDGKNVTLSTDFVTDLVYDWGAKYDTFGVEVPFHTSEGEDITVPGGGDYGWCIDIDETIWQVTKALENAENGEREVAWLYRAMGWDNGGLTGTYVEVSIDSQHLWCYKDYELVMETDVVTGSPTSERRTHTGIYAVDAKKSPAVLGSLDVQGYASPVGWWCPFNGGQGLHDAPWRGAFGGSIFQYDGSHGCVNIPVDNMETIYDTVEIGTAVVVY